ncbi:MAG: phage major capsid protein [Verrucomicrobiota bacterium]
MKHLIKNYRHLIALALVLSVAITGLCLDIFDLRAAFVFVSLWQLVEMAMSKQQAGVFYLAPFTPEQWEESDKLLLETKAAFEKVNKLAERLAKVEIQQLESPQRVRWVGGKPVVSDGCAKAIASVFVLDCAKHDGALENMVPEDSKRKRVLALAAGVLGIEVKTALTTADIPLPTMYVPEVVELVLAYGAARKYATVFPLGSGVVKLPRLKVGEDEFGFLGVGTAGMSQSVPEKTVSTDVITFTANKAGGTIRIPYEIDEDTFIPIGQFLTRYISRQLAKLEDRSVFLADGTATYANITGIAPYCAANPTYQLQLGSGKTKPSDATLADFRNLRAKVSAAILGNMTADGKSNAAYYLHPTFEPMLRSLNTYPNFVVFEYVDGQPMLDGFPVRWIGVSQSYSTSAAANKPLAFFGDLSYWYLGERGQIRFEVSKEVFFATDELAMRAMERIDVQARAIDAMATLQTAAS